MRKTKLFTVIFAVFLAGAISAQPLAASDASVIRVSGAASVTMMPDVASVSFRAITVNDDRQAAIEGNNAHMSNILQLLRQRGVEDDDIRTSSFSVREIIETIVDDEGYTRWVPAGYRVTNNVTATIRDLDEVGGIIAAVLATGANLTAGPTFRVSDTSAGYYEAIALASRSALNRATAIAGALDVRIVGVISVDETAGTNMPVIQGGAFIPAAPAIADGDGVPSPFFAAGATEVPVEASSITVTARVNIVFEIAP